MRRERTVPRFYFDVWEGGRVIRDNAGVELESLEAAEREARRAAAEMGVDTLPAGHCSEVRVQVRDNRDQAVLSVAVSMRVRRTGGAGTPRDFMKPELRIIQ
jgi:hypothetical protein